MGKLKENQGEHYLNAIGKKMKPGDNALAIPQEEEVTLQVHFIDEISGTNIESCNERIKTIHKPMYKRFFQK